MTLKHSTLSLADIATAHTLRCDAKHFSNNFVRNDKRIRAKPYFQLGDYLPPFTKGTQPIYLDAPSDDSVPIVNTLAVQRLSISEDHCRHISREDFDALEHDKRLRPGDVLLTMDGGVSIGKSTVFSSKGEFSVDSHVCILRPNGLDPKALMYLLASPIGQQQFRRAESGASGQTSVTEEDVRRFMFPESALKGLDAVVVEIEKEREAIKVEREKLLQREAQAWAKLATILS